MNKDQTYYRGDLPHFHPDDRPYFLTFRIAGSLPKDDAHLASVMAKKDFLAYDTYLDTLNMGHHWLKMPEIATIVKDAMHHRDGEEYELLAYCIMSNHVHMVIRSISPKPLHAVLQGMKSFTGFKCNKILNRTGQFWMHEGYDHVMRKGRLGYAVAYVLNNPVKAGLVEHWKEHPFTYLSPTLSGFE